MNFAFLFFPLFFSIPHNPGRCSTKNGRRSRPAIFLPPRERKLGEYLLAQLPGVAVRGVRIPRLKAWKNFGPPRLAIGKPPLERPNSPPETDHIATHQTAVIREKTPAEECSPQGGPVYPALAFVQGEPEVAQFRLDAAPRLFQKLPVVVK
jgi:hypothetical protein